MGIKKEILISSFIAAYSLGVGHAVHADDSELYVWSMSENDDVRPKVMILLDTSGSMVNNKLSARKPFTDTTYAKIYWSTDGSVPAASSTNYFLATANNCAASGNALTAVGKYTDVLLQWVGDANSGQAWKTLGNGTESSIVDCYADVRAADVTTTSNPATNVAGVPADAGDGPYSTDTTKRSSVFAYSSSVTLFTDKYVAWYAANQTALYTRLAVAEQAIKDIIYSNPNVDFGLAVYNKNDTSSSNGGRIIKTIQTLTNATRVSFLSGITGSGSTPLTESYYETSLYWAGKTAKWGKSTSQNPQFDPNAFTSGTDTYITPFKNEGCNDTSYSIVITDGEPNGDTAADSDIKNKYIASYTVGMSPTDKTKYSTVFSLPTSTHDKTSYLPHVAYYLYHTDLRSDLAGIQNVSTYTIGFGNDAVANAGALMQQTAQWGGGTYYPATDADALSSSLRKLMNAILDRQYSGITPSTSVNIQDRSENLDRLYYPMFSPKKGPFWPGNIKKLKLVNSSYIADVTGKLAIGTDGRILSTAQTYWSSVVDGSNVLLGGIQSALSKQASRKVLTNNGTTLLAVNKINLESIGGYTDTQMATYLGLTSSTDLDAQINWILGKDVDSQNTTSGLVNRQNVLSDMMHSQPVAINYGGVTPDVRLVVGSNAGFLHMFKDNNTTNTVSESWAFIPYELLPAQRTLRVNTDGVAHIYGLDATPVVYTTDTNGDGVISASDGDKVWLFMGQRQGGSNYYAFDITDPDNPVMMWKISGGSTGFEHLAQTWSTPQITKVPGYSNPVLIFGGGYNTGKDSLTLGTTDSVGNAIYIVDAETGVLKFSISPDGNLRNAAMLDSIAAPVKTVDYDSDGYTDIIYAADTGGNVWRVDLPDSTQSHWSISKLASVGSDSLRAEDRRFFGQPLVVTYSNTEVTKNDGIYTFSKKPVKAVLLGSGDRNHPRSDQVVGNMYFMFRDYRLAPYADSDTKAATIATNDLYDITSNPYGNAADDDAKKQILADITAKRGWKYRMTGTGEKVFGSGIVSDGILYFSSFLPEATVGANVCSVGNSIGTTRIYAIDLDLGFYPDGHETAFTAYNDTILDNLGSIVASDKSIRLLTPVPDGAALDNNNVVRVDAATGKPIECTDDAKCETQKIGDNLPKIFKVYQAEQR